MALDPRYVVDLSLENVFINKDTGLPLANGTIEFWEDNNRNSPKSVYQLSGAPPNYTYTALPNPITLNAIGVAQNVGGDNVAVYYYPYDSFGNEQLYYVVVKDQFGVVQFTREAWPNEPIGGINPGTVAPGSFVNMLTNPGFVDVNFDPSQTLTLTIGGAVANEVFPIAPGWDLVITTTGASAPTVQRVANTGTQGSSTNPDYTLVLKPGGNTTLFQLRQRLTNDTNVWAATPALQFGYVASSVSFGPIPAQITMQYVPSAGTPTTLLNATNNTGTFATFDDTVQLPAANNPQNADVAYVDIVLNLPTTTTVELSSVQAIGLYTNITQVPYDQQPANRQRDYMAHYYKPQLAYKPIPSYLIGWDFPKNPAQFLGDTVSPTTPVSIGANKSKYVWDQTIIFQSVNDSIGVSRGTDGSLEIEAQIAGQVAVIQYLDQVTARQILNGRASVYLSGYTSVAAGLRGIVSLYATTDVSLPDIKTPNFNSIVATLAASGKPATFNGVGWSEVPRKLGNASFLLSTDSQEFYLNGWDLEGAAPTNTATYFAIVIGFPTLALNETINLYAVSLCPGDMATKPAPKTDQETTIDCNRFYWKTFNPGTVPAENAGVGTGDYRWTVTQVDAGDNYSPSIIFPAPMVSTPAITFYNPAAANALARNLTPVADDANTTDTVDCNLTPVSFNIHAQGVAGWLVGERLAVHITADARLGTF